MGLSCTCVNHIPTDRTPNASAGPPAVTSLSETGASSDAEPSDRPSVPSSVKTTRTEVATDSSRGALMSFELRYCCVVGEASTSAGASEP